MPWSFFAVASRSPGIDRRAPSSRADKALVAAGTVRAGYLQGATELDGPWLL